VTGSVCAKAWSSPCRCPRARRKVPAANAVRSEHWSSLPGGLAPNKEIPDPDSSKMALSQIQVFDSNSCRSSLSAASEDNAPISFST